MSDTNRRRFKRTTADRIAAVQQPLAVADTLDYTNADDYASIRGREVRCYYEETDATGVGLDAVGDDQLWALHDEPTSFSNEESLPLYESLVSRARFDCKQHPNITLAREQAALETQLPTDDWAVFVYKRDTAAKSPVKDRRNTPFANLGQPIALFLKEGFDPFLRGTLVWHRALRAGGRFGLFAIDVADVGTHEEDRNTV